jgi:membrane protease YdiL (CAAX protease family)
VSTSNEQNKKPSSFVRLAVAGEAGLLLVAWGLGRWLGISPLEQLRPSVESVAWGVAASLPLFLGLAWILSTQSGPARRLVDLVVEQLGPLLSQCSTAMLALLAAVAGISEEILFRGVVQVGLAGVLPEGWALLATSAAFGLVHFASGTYAILAAGMGLYLGTLFLVQGTLLAPIIAHALYDFVALVYLTRRSRASQEALRCSTSRG